MTSIKYGRGTFEPSKAYVDYINMIADSPAYSGLPSIRSENGKINWQCSSGKTTPFYKYFPARFRWWVQKADELGIAGTENSDGRLTIAARMIHPNKKKVCLICGEERYIGYMYMNANFAHSWNKLVGEKIFQKTMLISEATKILVDKIGKDKTRREILSVFPEKKADISIFDDGHYEEFFSKTQYIRSTKLSPGYMGDCPHRLDGLHDYCIFCRKENDPGRSDDNMRTYIHDRRAFMWWAEGDWKVADTLYNSATSGICANCGRRVKKISPDHIGPLACGFKQNGLFEPLCGRCNSSKNRRFTFDNINTLLAYETNKDESVASWQVRTLWDSTKNKTKDDNAAKTLSNYMRAMQDYYLRSLNHFAENGCYDFLSLYLHPEYANYTISFEGLDTSTLTFKSFSKRKKTTKGTRSLASRTVRIAYEELAEYCSKATTQRKSIIFNITDDFLKEDIERIDVLTSKYILTTFDKELSRLLACDISFDEKDKEIQELIESLDFSNRYSRNTYIQHKYEEMVNDRGLQLAEKCIAEIS